MSVINSAVPNSEDVDLVAKYLTKNNFCLIKLLQGPGYSYIFFVFHENLPVKFSRKWLLGLMQRPAAVGCKAEFTVGDVTHYLIGDDSAYPGACYLMLEVWDLPIWASYLRKMGVA